MAELWVAVYSDAYPGDGMPRAVGHPAAHHREAMGHEDPGRYTDLQGRLALPEKRHSVEKGRFFHRR